MADPVKYIASNLLAPGQAVKIDNQLHQVESVVKVTVPKGRSFIKVRFKDLTTEKITEKNLEENQKVEEAILVKKTIEYLYKEENDYLFLDIATLEQILIPQEIIGKKIHLLKEGTEVSAMLCGSNIFSIELPQFLEIQVIKTDSQGAEHSTSSSKQATLETGASMTVPSFIESGDVIKVDTTTLEYIQRV